MGRTGLGRRGRVGKVRMGCWQGRAQRGRGEGEEAYTPAAAGPIDPHVSVTSQPDLPPPLPPARRPRATPTPSTCTSAWWAWPSST